MAHRFDGNDKCRPTCRYGHCDRRVLVFRSLALLDVQYHGRYGLETARHFLSKGWNVIATMRTPREEALPRARTLRILPLDVTDENSIAAAIKAAGPIDVLVNNAGIGAVGAFEATPLSYIRKVFETNTFGVWR